MLAGWDTLGGQVAYNARGIWIWLPTEDEILRKFAKAKKSARAASKKIKCTYYTARHRAEKLGVKFRPKHIAANAWTKREHNILRAGIAAGETPASIAKYLERGEAAVRCRAQRLGLKFPRLLPNDPWTEDCLERAKAWWLDGISGGVIAQRLGPPFTRNSVIGKAHRKHWRRPNRTQATATRVELRKRANAFRLAKRLKVKPMVHPLACLQRWRGPPKPPTEFVAEAMDVARITHAQLGSEHCRWPVGDPAKVFVPFYCGQPRMRGLPYCVGHCLRAFNSIPAFPRQSYSDAGHRLAAAKGEEVETDTAY